MLLFPLLVWLGIANRSGPALAQFFAVIGALSYPLYITQAAVLRIGLEVLRRHAFTPPQFVAFALAEAACALLLAWLAMRWFDAPMQRLLRQRPPAQPIPEATRGALA
jgi:peptidoglycan/LPS O-acetylase OafA/YrhL